MALFDTLLHSLGLTRLVIEPPKETVAKSSSEREGLAYNPMAQAYQQMQGQYGLRKANQITFQTLRRMASANWVDRTCISTLRDEITGIPWDIVPINPKQTWDTKFQQYVIELLKRPNRNNENWRTLIDKVVEDILVCDAGTIEKVRNNGGMLMELWHLDGATVKPCYDKHGIIGDPAYQQFLPNQKDAKPVAEWRNEDLIYIMWNPQGTVDSFGYGMSPVEAGLAVGTAFLYAEAYNLMFFKTNSIPPVILNMGKEVPAGEIDKFRMFLASEMMGPNGFHQPIITSLNEGASVIPLTKAPADMAWEKYVEWQMRWKVALYRMSPQDIGFTLDQYKVEGQVQAQMSQNKAINSLKNVLKHYIDTEIIGDLGFRHWNYNLQFQWIDTDVVDPLDQASVDKIYLMQGVKSINEIRQRDGLDPIAGGTKPTLISGATVIPIDSTPIAQDDETALQPMNKHTVEKVFSASEGEIVPMSMNQTALAWMDDRGVTQPLFITDTEKTKGFQIKSAFLDEKRQQDPPEATIATNLRSMKVNTPEVHILNYDQVLQLLPQHLYDEFTKYLAVQQPYDSQQWRQRWGDTRKSNYFIITGYVSGKDLGNHQLQKDMAASPYSYQNAIEDLAKVWVGERLLLLGDRKPGHYIITNKGNGFGVDYQFPKNEKLYQKTKFYLPQTLALISSELKDMFDAKVEEVIKDFDTSDLQKYLDLKKKDPLAKDYDELFKNFEKADTGGYWFTRNGMHIFAGSNGKEGKSHSENDHQEGTGHDNLFTVSKDGVITFTDEKLEAYNQKLQEISDKWVNQATQANKNAILQAYGTRNGQKVLAVQVNQLKNTFPENVNPDGTIKVYRGGNIPTSGVYSYTVSKSDADGYATYNFGSPGYIPSGERPSISSHEISVRSSDIIGIINGEELLISSRDAIRKSADEDVKTDDFAVYLHQVYLNLKKKERFLAEKAYRRHVPKDWERMKGYEDIQKRFSVVIQKAIHNWYKKAIHLPSRANTLQKGWVTINGNHVLVGGDDNIYASEKRVYHGTNKQSAEAIRQEGFNSALGQGGMSSSPVKDFTFVTPSEDGAKYFSEQNIRSKKFGGPEVIEATLNGKLLNISGSSEDYYAALGKVGEKLSVPYLDPQRYTLDVEGIKQALVSNDYVGFSFKDGHANNRTAYAITIPTALSLKKSFQKAANFDPKADYLTNGIWVYQYGKKYPATVLGKGNAPTVQDVLLSTGDYKEAFLYGAEQAKVIYQPQLTQLGVKDIKLTTPALYEKVFAQRVDQTQDVIGTSMGQALDKTISDGLTNGLTYAEIADTIRSNLGIDPNDPAVPGWRAERIARTESQWAIGEGMRQQYDAAGIDKVNISPSLSACDICEEVAAGNPYNTEEAAGILPVHPNCMCVLVGDYSQFNKNKELQKGWITLGDGRHVLVGGIGDEKTAGEFINNSKIKDTVYHGSDAETQTKIKESGFQPDKQGAFGDAVYFTEKPDDAGIYGTNITSAKINVGRVKEYETTTGFLNAATASSLTSYEYGNYIHSGQGYDAIRFKDTGTLAVFNPEHTMAIVQKLTKAEQEIAEALDEATRIVQKDWITINGRHVLIGEGQGGSTSRLTTQSMAMKQGIDHMKEQAIIQLEGRRDGIAGGDQDVSIPKDIGAMVRAIDTSTATTPLEAASMILEKLPQGIRSNPPVQTALNNWGKQYEMIMRYKLNPHR